MGAMATPNVFRSFRSVTNIVSRPTQSKTRFRRASMSLLQALGASVPRGGARVQAGGARRASFHAETTFSMPSATATTAYPGYARARKKLENNARRAGKPGTAPIMRAFSFLVRVVLAAVLLPLDLLMGDAVRTGDMTRPLMGAFGVVVAYGAFRAAEVAVGIGRASSSDDVETLAAARFRVRPPAALDPCRLLGVPLLSRSSACAYTGAVARVVVEPFEVTGGAHADDRERNGTPRSRHGSSAAGGRTRNRAAASVSMSSLDEACTIPTATSAARNAPYATTTPNAPISGRVMSPVRTASPMSRSSGSRTAARTTRTRNEKARMMGAVPGLPARRALFSSFFRARAYPGYAVVAVALGIEKVVSAWNDARRAPLA